MQLLDRYRFFGLCYGQSFDIWCFLGHNVKGEVIQVFAGLHVVCDWVGRRPFLCKTHCLFRTHSTRGSQNCKGNSAWLISHDLHVFCNRTCRGPYALTVHEHETAFHDNVNTRTMLLVEVDCVTCAMACNTYKRSPAGKLSSMCTLVC